MRGQKYLLKTSQPTLDLRGPYLRIFTLICRRVLDCDILNLLDLWMQCSFSPLLNGSAPVCCSRAECIDLRQLLIHGGHSSYFALWLQKWAMWNEFAMWKAASVSAQLFMFTWDIMETVTQTRNKTINNITNNILMIWIDVSLLNKTEFKLLDPVQLPDTNNQSCLISWRIWLVWLIFQEGRDLNT